MATFKNPNDPDNLIIIGKIQEWVRSAMKLEAKVSVEIIEVDCADPGCMDKETRIIVGDVEGERKQYRIHKPLVFVRKPDVDYLIKSK